MAPKPALITVTAGATQPRYPSLKGIMAAKSKPVDEVKVADLGLDAAIVGWAGAGQEIVDVSAAPEREAGEVIEDDGEAHTKIIEFLDGLKVL
jgi:electron transfer flavoprotein beta subunit